MEVHEQVSGGNTQSAPYPDQLVDLVRRCTYRPGWRVSLTGTAFDRGQGSFGMTLLITTDTVDTYHPKRPVRVQHLFPVPPAAFDARSWQRWLFERFREVESHECAEFFQIDGNRPYAPSHGPGNDPYLIREVGTAEDVHTSFRGVVSLPVLGELPGNYPTAERPGPPDPTPHLAELPPATYSDR